ncbi:MAG: glutamine--tRNA ligase, partial [Candidatus Sumerlaeia bacterium]|nr:glutamine--tRNA ligase [Candidatus Sumerlaeia bacterium]
LYDWILDTLGVYHPQQIEFARLNLTHTLLSKRKLLQMVEEGHVTGWDDPRMPTISGLRRRGFTPAAIRNFCEKIGVAKRDGIVEMALLEHCIREDLNRNAPRFMAVLNPLKVVLTNYPEGEEEFVEAVNNPEDPTAGTRQVPFSRELYIEREDFMEDPPKKFFRLAPGREVRLRYGYFITCNEVIKDPATGEITALHCTYDPETRGGNAPDGRKVKATMHWVSARHARRVEVRLYESLFNRENPDKVDAEGGTFRDNINPDSLRVLDEVMVEPALAELPVGSRVQFERQGYFTTDRDSTATNPVFNRTVTLKDSWAKISSRGG